MDSEITSAINNVNEIVSPLQEVIDAIVDDYTSGLTDLMSEIDDNIIQVDDPSVETVRKYFMQLSSCMYFVAPRVENMSLFDAISKIKLKEKFDDAFLKYDVRGIDGKSPTATKLTTLAETDSRYESMVNEMYNKAYKIIKSRVDAAQTMIGSLSKLFSFKMSEVNSINNSRLLME